MNIVRVNDGGFGANILTQALTSGLDTLVESVEVESTIGPPIFINEPFRSSPSGAAPAPGAPGAPAQPGFDVMRLLKPRINVRLRDGSVQSFTPYGDPGPSRWPWVTIGIVGGLSVLVYLAFFKRCGR